MLITMEIYAVFFDDVFLLFLFVFFLFSEIFFGRLFFGLVQSKIIRQNDLGAFHKKNLRPLSLKYLFLGF